MQRETEWPDAVACSSLQIRFRVVLIASFWTVLLAFYVFRWTGDVVYTHLLDNVHKMVDGGMNLQPYVHPDCGGHYGVPFEQETPEMFVRWTQFCAMGTIIRFHTNKISDHRPWTWGAEAEAAIQKVLKLRYSLMPTLIAAGQRATLDGTPVVQRLDLTWPELAEEGAGRNDQYLFADGSMLVAPIIPFNGSDPVAKNPTNGTGNASRTVWIPPGQWQDAWGVQGVVQGPRSVRVVDCPMDQIPMWHRKGSLVLTAAPHQSTAEQDWSQLSIEVFLFPIAGSSPPLTPAPPTTVHAEPMVRSWTSEFYDTKSSLSAPPHTPITLEQHRTSGAATVHIGGGAAGRTWMLRIHLLPDEQISSAGIRLDGVSVPFAVRVQHARLMAAGTSTPLISTARTLGSLEPQWAGLLGGSSTDAGSGEISAIGSVVEVEVVSGPDAMRAVQFDVV
jgi:hypothetical protein